MTKSVLSFLLLLSGVIYGQSDLPVGAGVLKIDFDKKPNLEFFDDTLQSKPVKAVSVVTNAQSELVLQHEEGNGSWFIPEQLFLEYGIFLVRVDSVIGKWYKVIVNTETAAALWLKTDPARQFISWPAFLLKETTAVDMGSEDLDVKTGASEKSATIKKMERKDCFEVLEIKGDWMKIRTNKGLECNESKRPVKLGWIRWRYKNRLMIGYALTC